MKKVENHRMALKRMKPAVCYNVVSCHQSFEFLPSITCTEQRRSTLADAHVFMCNVSANVSQGKKVPCLYAAIRHDAHIQSCYIHSGGFYFYKITQMRKISLYFMRWFPSRGKCVRHHKTPPHISVTEETISH